MANGHQALATAPTMGGGMRATEGFGERSLARVAETASMAVAEQARASVQARFIIAERKPRDMDNVRVRVLQECTRRGFAEVARYAKPVGGQTIRGPSVRFVEAALRQMGNVLLETPTIYDDADKRIVRVIATDLETNATYQKDLVIDKTVERRSPKQGQEVLGSRTNSNGSTVYLVRANEDDLLNKEAALVSKAVRNLGLRLIPGDIVEEAMGVCCDTMERQDAENPSAARNKVSDAFAQLGVMPSDLKAWLGHDLAQSSPAELRELRGLYAAIRDGETTWAAIMETKTGGTPSASSSSASGDTKALPQAAEASVQEPSPKAAGLREKLAAKKTAAKAAAPTMQAPPPPPAAPAASSAATEDAPPELDDRGDDPERY